MTLEGPANPPLQSDGRVGRPSGSLSRPPLNGYIVIPTNAMRPEEFAEHLRRLVEPKWVRPPATEGEFRSVERRLGVVVPADLRAFYGCVGGADEATPLENGWMTFWPLDRWERGTGEVKNGLGLVLLADHGIVSWSYGAAISASAQTPIFIVDGVRPPRLVAASFSAFVAAALADDRSIYAAPLERGAG